MFFGKIISLMRSNYMHVKKLSDEESLELQSRISRIRKLQEQGWMSTMVLKRRYVNPSICVYFDINKDHINNGLYMMQYRYYDLRFCI